MSNLPRDISYDAVFSILEEKEDRLKAELIEKTPWYFSKAKKLERAEGMAANLRALRDIRVSLEIHREESAKRR